MTVVRGTVFFLYDAYYGKSAHVVVVPAGSAGRKTKGTMIPVQVQNVGQNATFTWRPPAASSAKTYRFSIVEQPKAPDPDYDYAQHSDATITVPSSGTR